MIRRPLAIGFVLAACAAAVVLSAASDGDSKGKRYRVVFDNAFGLTQGGELRIGGVKAGRINDFELTESEPKKVITEVEVSQPGFASLRTDATCEVRQQSLIGEYFVDCQLGTDRRELPDGGTVPVEQTASTIPPDLIANVMRRPYRERFRLIINELGTGLAGRPEELNEVIRRAHPALRETTETLEILARQNEIIKEFIRNADTVSQAVEPRKEQLARWAVEASQTAAIQASREADLSAQWRRLPVFLRELKPTVEQLERTADQQIPLLRKLRVAAPDLERFFTEIGPFSESSRISNRALGRAAVTGRTAIEESKEEIAQLTALSKDAPRLARPLRQFLQTIDDRGRSTENDPLSDATAPPAPDKTAADRGPGFTGMEGLLNYVYYQALATNAFDNIGHVLRIVAIQSASCSPYSAKPTPARIKGCASWLGPYQPGVTTPDPTEGGAAPASSARKKGQSTGADDDRRGAGDPEAPPTPGRPDPSRPQITVPPVLDRLPPVPGRREPPGRGPPASPDRPGGPPEDLLDFLLGP